MRMEAGRIEIPSERITERTRSGFGVPRYGAKCRKQFAADTVMIVIEIRHDVASRGTLLRRHAYFEYAFMAVQMNDIAVAYQPQRTAVQTFGGDMNRRRHRTRGTRHASVGHQCHFETLTQERTQRGRQ